MDYVDSSSYWTLTVAATCFSKPSYGYWAFEAAAVSVLFNIDDTPFRHHPLYPKDLADWARANHSKP
ncbi:PoNe immunity protein domain-containing protein [Cupriavidus plantarum]|uniref:PoNe immunity protein domain-containing protein n=1 Tax=Cupriavidus plantarum TaxID=942865 RepID=UPI0017AA34F9|nr:PoNe immunity protein domain-containing protein [Cupriavidus plantarum]NYI01990.1 hypothetical protein [Cupriavidus plantarum]